MGDHWMRAVISSRAKWQHSLHQQYPLKALSMQTDKNWYPVLNISVKRNVCLMSLPVFLHRKLMTKRVQSAFRL